MSEHNNLNDVNLGPVSSSPHTDVTHKPNSLLWVQSPISPMVRSKQCKFNNIHIKI